MESADAWFTPHWDRAIALSNDMAARPGRFSWVVLNRTADGRIFKIRVDAADTGLSSIYYVANENWLDDFAADLMSGMFD
jgi:hypothetical protein